MKKILFLVSIILMIKPANAADNLSSQNLAEQQARKIYENCEREIPQVEENNVITGNVADVERIRKIKTCLRKNIISQIQNYLQAGEIKHFTTNLENDERIKQNLYKSLYFCSKYNDDVWCDNRYNDDMSLNKLMLEHKLSKDLYNLLVDVLEAKNGSSNF